MLKKKNVKRLPWMLGSAALAVVLTVVAIAGFYAATTRSAAVQITAANRTAWTAATMEDARDEVARFLGEQYAASLPRPDASRPYMNNPTYSEGSLAALTKSLLAAQDLPADTAKAGKDMMRVQLIQNVRDLETKAVFAGDELSKILLNNYPDSEINTNGTYTIEMKYPQEGAVPASSFDIVFAMDWSNSMNHSYTHAPPPLIGISEPVLPNCARLMAKDTIINVCADLFDDFPESRICLLGMNVPAAYNLTTDVSKVYMDENTGFVGKNEYATKIQNAFSRTPTNSADSPVVFATVARQILDGRADKSRTPVLILISDYQICANNTPSAIAAANTYWDVNMSNEADAFHATYPTGRLLAIRSDHYGNVSYQDGLNMNNTANEKMSNSFIKYNHWAWMTLNPDNFTNANAQIKAMIVHAMESDFTITDPMGGRFDYIPNSWSGTTDPPEYDAATDTLTYEGDAIFTSQYEIKANAAQLASGSYGQTYATNGTTTVTNEAGSTNAHDIPQAYLPLTLAAIELYQYEGAIADSTNKNNYTLTHVVAGSNLSLLGGTGSYTVNSTLNNLPYGSAITRSNALNALQASLPAAVSGYSVIDSLSDTEIQVVFNAGRNIFQIYMFRQNLAFTVTESFVEYGNAANELAPDQTTSVQQGSNFAPASGTPPATITKNGVTYSYIGYQVDSDYSIIYDMPPLPLFANVQENHAVTYLYETTYNIIGKYHLIDAPYTKLRDDTLFLDTVWSGDYFQPAGHNQYETIIYDGFYYHYTDIVKVNSDTAAQQPETTSVMNITSDTSIIFCYTRGHPVDGSYVLHIRQIVLDRNNQIERPDKGFHVLTGSSGQRNLTSVSSEYEWSAKPYTTYIVGEGTQNTFSLDTVVPQYYAYDGYTMATAPEPDGTAHTRVHAPIEFIFTPTDSEYWITVYITPEEDHPGNYSWDFETNDFGLIG